MLDQRRAAEKGYITLKEAAKISNYSPDYVGQLIRGGKIRGEQVYASTAWVTTEDEIFAYMGNKQRTVHKNPCLNRHTIQQASLYALYLAIAGFAVVVVLLQYVFYISLDTTVSQKYTTRETHSQEIPPVIISVGN